MILTASSAGESPGVNKNEKREIISRGLRLTRMFLFSSVLALIRVI